MITEQSISQLWLRMARIYGHKWTSNFGETDDGTWLTGLKDLLPEELGDGLRACINRTDKWPPSLPEFRCLCLDIPDMAVVVHEAIGVVAAGEVGESDSFAQRLLGTLSSWNLKHATTRELVKMLEANYEMLVGEQIQDRKELPHDERLRLTHDG